MENTPTQVTNAPVQPVRQNPLLWLCTLLLILSFAGNAYLFLQLTQQMAVNTSLAQQLSQKSMLADDQPLITPSAVPIPEKKGLDLQAYLNQHCIFDNTTQMFSMKLSDAPFVVAPTYLFAQTGVQAKGKLTCVSPSTMGTPSTSLAADSTLMFSLARNPAFPNFDSEPDHQLTAYDSRSIEPGHDGLPFFGNGTSTIAVEGDVTYSVNLDFGIMATPQSVPLVLRAVKKMGSDQQSYSIILSAGNILAAGDPKLVALLTPHSKFDADSNSNLISISSSEKTKMLLDSFVSQNKAELMKSKMFVQAQEVMKAISEK